jgi:hypothetical protein
MAPIEERESFLVALAGAPEQHVVSFLVRDAHLSYKTFCPALYVHSAIQRDRFPTNLLDLEGP